MTRFAHDDILQSAIVEARRRSLAWFATLQAPGAPLGVMRASAAHDPVQWPGVLLSGTYNAVMALDLIGGLADLDAADRAALVAWFEASRRDDGIVRVQGMTDDAVFKKPDREETWRYIDFHVTNYTLGAIEALDPARPQILTFAKPFLDPLVLESWLARRDLRDPWQEGNNIVNLGSFLLAIQRDGTPEERRAAAEAMERMFLWHDRLQEPATGFWGVGQLSDKTAALHAMAGSMHNFHLWYATGRPLAYQDRAIDYALSQPPVVDSACIDVDLVDLLVHGYDLIDHRRDDIRRWLRELLPALLAFQNPDGGFPDVREGTRRLDGWVRGYEEPQGLSNTFATWFRWIAIAMIADCLWPGWQAWRFRRSVGIGYRLERRA